MTRTPHILMPTGVSIFLTIGCQTNPQTTGHYIDDTAITTSVKTHLATDGPLKTMTQISVKTGRMKGYIKPFFRDMKVYDARQDKEKSLLRKLCKGRGGAWPSCLKANHGRKSQPGRIYRAPWKTLRPARSRPSPIWIQRLLQGVTFPRL